MSQDWKFTIVVPKGECIVPSSTAAALRAAADMMEWQGKQPSALAGPGTPGVPQWRLMRWLSTRPKKAKKKSG